MSPNNRRLLYPPRVLPLSDELPVGAPNFPFIPQERVWRSQHADFHRTLTRTFSLLYFSSLDHNNCSVLMEAASSVPFLDQNWKRRSVFLLYMQEKKTESKSVQFGLVCSLVSSFLLFVNFFMVSVDIKI